MKKKLLLTLAAIGSICLLGLSSKTTADLQYAELVAEALTNTARAYFKAGVESALLSQALNPDLRGDAASRGAYQTWLSRNTNCPYIKMP